MIFDFDQHLFEYPGMWVDHIAPEERDLALTVERDELGFPWVFSRATNQRIYIYAKTVPEDGFASHVTPWQRWKDHQSPETDYLADVPEDLQYAGARVRKLDEQGVDKALLLPHFGFLWGRQLGGRLDIMRANLSAWNRWAASVKQDGGERLEPTGHVTLRGGDPAWLERELAYLARSGVRFALISYGLVDGRRMSHPDHDRAWKAFVDNGIIPVFHIQDGDVRASGLPEGWFEADGDPLFGPLDFVFSHLGVQVAVADLILGGVFDRFPSLKFVTVELTAGWINPLISGGTGIPGSIGGVVNGPGLDVSYRVEGFFRRNTVALKRAPSEYLYEHFRSTVNPVEPLGSYVESGLGDNLLFGGDYPHSEGFLKAVDTFQPVVADLTEEQRSKFFGGTAAALLTAS
ncbi:amidohydrolase family protein [Actinomadura madurae]|uniref:amidohydrolase family protein n=1 Tax=Actinomadura madurae TaxID=1993 RepID=UPI00399A21BB